jgi:Domain of unknown function (DUF4395)
MSKTIKFGETVPGYDIRVLNEREIRAAAGILFLATFLSLMLILFENNFIPIKYTITLFLVDFIIRVFINPRLSPTLIIGRLIVRRQTPEYVGARQKRFAWIIGLFLSATMFTFMVVVNAFSPITGITCLICLTFLFFESAFGICLGCKCYSLFNKGKAQYCPGEVCERKSRHEIQKVSGTQLLVVGGFMMLIVCISIAFKKNFAKQPYDMFGLFASETKK